MSVNDPFVMHEFEKFLKSNGTVTFLSDNGEFSKSCGLEKDCSAYFMGMRCKRFAMIIENNKVQYIGVDENGLEKSSAEEILKNL
jgi:glutaredoxin/glutathione-dependent peroxiredoxin